MKGFPQPLSEAFIYTSPERLRSDSYRWVGQGEVRAPSQRKRQKEVVRGNRCKH
jgi:hypothetical protein